MITQNDIFIMPVFHKKASGNRPEPDKSQLLIQSQRISVGGDHCIKLQDAKPQFLSFLHAVCYQLFPDMLSSHALFYSVAGIADMPAAPDIIRMKDVQPDNLRYPRRKQYR